ncbi:hypothetical protein SNOG_04456 [Parastagonospora nodorum SN15]|uniref:Rhodopsin domain-containing protein n=1 Tax=Phaeosphaeria nodorum (strain SN15 / ATCC MYA-4574 / FGSC 10173) TaxID=321614 RepID=Q0UUV8_PHANO|nr:hypothetical protein SNOG_04456 [Parastagonospora nodorum SN15]EAT88216.1 hypothetical protein SNOG_04456 [Parastagonospora nodorum SN15]
MATVYFETGKHLTAASISLMVVDIIAVAFKFWVRLRLKQPLMADDWLLVPATVLSIGLGAMLTYGVSQGALGGSIDIPPGGDGRAELEMARLTLGRKCGINFKSNWGSVKLFAAHCPDSLWILFVGFLTSAILDVYILVLPMPFIWMLKLGIGKKIGVTIILLIGSALSSTLYWGMIELGVGIFVACIPTVQKFCRQQDRQGLLSHIGMAGASSSSSRTVGSKDTNKPRICVDHTVNIAYGDLDADRKPKLSRLESVWARHGTRSECNAAYIEMQPGRSRWLDRTKTRPAY